ncbi:hypothetical protein MTP99_006839 [Tenebrio molitor]|nr:hypothetical protein MTP99_006839 [Tenebrio molitor]
MVVRETGDQLVALEALTIISSLGHNRANILVFQSITIRWVFSLPREYPNNLSPNNLSPNNLSPNNLSPNNLSPTNPDYPDYLDNSNKFQQSQ